jgi:hypothetical protein
VRKRKSESENVSEKDGSNALSDVMAGCGNMNIVETTIKQKLKSKENAEREHIEELKERRKDSLLSKRLRAEPE